MKKFEYRLLEAADKIFEPIDYQELNQQLNTLGREGWEVVAVANVGSKWWSRRARRLLITLKREWA